MSGRDGGAGAVEDLRQVRPLAPDLLVPLALVSLTQSLVFDLGRYGSDRRTIAAAALSLIAQACCYLMLAALASLLRPSAARAILTGAAYLASAAIKSLVLVTFALESGRSTDLLLRLPGDITFATLLFVAMAIAVSTRRRHADTHAQLMTARCELLERRSSRVAIARSVDERLRRQAEEALGGELEEIVAALGDEVGIRTLPADLASLIERRVRPLARALSAHADHVERIEPSAELRSRIDDLRDLRLDPRQDLRVTGPYLAASLNILVTTHQLATLPVALAVQAASLTIWIGLVAARAVWPRGRTFGVAGLLVTVPLGAGALSVPMLAVLHRVTLDHPDLRPVRVSAAATILLFIQIATLWTALGRAREEELVQITEVTEDLDRELALLEQATWVTQRRWSYLIHGAVQGALTVARSRLMAAIGMTPELEDRVRGDLARARAALEGPSEFGGDATELLAEIAMSWQGLCALELDLEVGLLAELDRDATSATCMVELVKELVSNAYRHGGATRVRVSGTLGPGREAILTSWNDGSSIPDDLEPGLGFRMFDDLTRWWRIDRETALVIVALPIG